MPNLLVEHECAQCGAPVVLTESDRLFRCEYCRVRSYLFPRDFFRHMLPNAVPEDRRLIFFPYWRFRGMLFSCFPKETTHRFTDFSHQGIASDLFPKSVGLRGQALRLRFLSPETKGVFLKPTLSFKEVMRGYRQFLEASFPEPVLHQAFVGESLSLLYSPFYVSSGGLRLFDGVLDKTVGPDLAEGVEASLLSSGERPDWRLRLVPAICPKCGWDLSGQRDALALNCENCDTAWCSDGTDFRELDAVHVPESGDDIEHLPFWQMKADVSGVRLDSYGDMIRIANLPKVANPEDGASGFCFWTPAFKARPKIFMNLSLRMTLSQPREETAPGLPAAPCHSVTLPHTAAAKSLKIVLASIMKPRRMLSQKLGETRIKAKTFRLVHVPFRKKHQEFVHTAYRMAVSRNMLRLTGIL